MKITDRQMGIDYLTSAALVSIMKEIEIDGQKLTRQDQQAITIGLINRVLALLADMPNKENMSSIVVNTLSKPN